MTQFPHLPAILLHAHGQTPDVGDHTNTASNPAAVGEGPVVVITTAKKAEWITVDPNEPFADLLLVDEGWQMTWAQLQAVCGLAPRLAMVGDSMQLPPVTTADVRRWQHLSDGPHVPAPIALAARRPVDVTHVALPATRRFGPHTAAALSEVFYPPGEGFGSVAVADTSYAAGPWTPTELSAITTADVVDTAAAAANLAHDADRDVGVVAPHVSMVAELQAKVRPGIRVDTTERWQGLEADLTVIVHPLAVDEPTGFELTGGRMCVALSRHRHQCLLVSPTNISSRLFQASLTDPASAGVAIHLNLIERMKL